MLTKKLGNFMLPMCPVPAFLPTGTMSTTKQNYQYDSSRLETKGELTLLILLVRKQRLSLVRQADVLSDVLCLLCSEHCLCPLHGRDVSHGPDILCAFDLQEFINDYVAVLVQIFLRNIG